jgi:hypothetical protein
MSQSVAIHGVQYISAQAAASEFGYTADYVARLAREQKIASTRIGRQWFVEIQSLCTFIDQVQREKRQRSHMLRRSRRLELAAQNRAAAAASASLSANFPSLTFFTHALRHASAHTHRYAPRASALLQTAAVTLTGVALGLTIYGADFSPASGTAARLALVSQESAAQLSARAATASDALAAFSLGAFLDNVRLSFAWPFAEVDHLLADRAPEKPSAEKQQGLVVFPENGQTEDQIDSIKNSFSDDVNVTFDPDDPSTGVVTPVFRDRTGDAYRFVLVPVRNGASP